MLRWRIGLETNWWVIGQNEIEKMIWSHSGVLDGAVFSLDNSRDSKEEGQLVAISSGMMAFWG